MALISTIFCSVCRQNKDVSHSAAAMPPDICHQCQKHIEENKRSKHLAELRKLTVEERLARIEAELYDESKRPKPFDWNTPIG